MKEITLADLEDPPIEYLQDYEVLFEMELVQIRRYAESVEQLLSAHSKKVLQTISTPTSGITEEEKEECLGWYASEMDELENTFPKILRYSLFVHSYSLFERALMSIAKAYQKARKLPLSPSDLKDKGIEQAQVYLKKVVSVPFPDTGSVWQEISTLTLIRNKIVHNEGELPAKNTKEGKSIQAFAKKWPGDISAEYADVALHKTFVFRVLDTFHAFFLGWQNKLE